MANLKDVIYLSNADYATLVSTGTVTIGGVTLTYDPDNVYITPEENATPSSDGLMSAIDKTKLDSIVNQSSYSAKGSSTKVPQITTNTWGQVTDITEVNIAFPVTDVKINNTSIVSSGVANFVTNTAYNASTNKIATMSDLPTTLDDISDGTTRKLSNYVPYTGATGSVNLGHDNSLTAKELVASVNNSLSTTYKPGGIQASGSIGGSTGSATYSFPFTEGTGSFTLATREWVADQGYGPGTVTSVGIRNGSTSQGTLTISGSPITSSGTIDITLTNNYGDTKNPYASKTANYVLAAPNGSNGAPSFRALVAADIPNLGAGKITSGTFDIARIPTGTSSSTVALGNHNHDSRYLKLTGGTATGDFQLTGAGGESIEFSIGDGPITLHSYGSDSGVHIGTTTNSSNQAILKANDVSGQVVFNFPNKSSPQTFAMLSDLAAAAIEIVDLTDLA